MGEELVCWDYVFCGYVFIVLCWCGLCGEIDLIMQCGDEYVFVEVKVLFSYVCVVEWIDWWQMDRICNVVFEFCIGFVQGLLMLMWFDVVLVDVMGCVQVIENVFGLV